MIEIDSDLRDIVISAFRYALGRKTYVTEETCSFIKKYPELINKRVKDVLLRDLEKLDMYYLDNEVDYNVFVAFGNWLKKLEVE